MLKMTWKKKNMQSEKTKFKIIMIKKTDEQNYFNAYKLTICKYMMKNKNFLKTYQCCIKELCINVSKIKHFILLEVAKATCF